jgi:peroxiredoxin (alkyl hydroperoxide reductase subunit C)
MNFLNRLLQPDPVLIAPGHPGSDVLPPGTLAPGFTLINAAGEAVSLEAYRGRPVILAFYPADWSPVCGDQLALYNEVLPMFESNNAQLLAISVDGSWSHKAFSEARNLRFPLLSDFEPKGEVSRRYNAFNEEAGLSERALYVIDGDGIIRWSHLSPKAINPGANGILEALEQL